MSSYHLASDLIPFYIAALKRYRVEYVFGYTSSIYALAKEMLVSGVNDLQMAVVITNAEPLFDYQREAISEAFQCPVRETYGMAEIVATASECGAGRLHLWPEVGHVEFLENDQIIQGGPGDLICTGLFNTDMPFVRYRVGDRSSLDSLGGLCSCGRFFPQLGLIEGRIDDVLYTRDGRYVGRLDPVFKGGLAIREAQIIQETLDTVRLLYVPSQDFNPKTTQVMVQRLRDRMGNIEVILQQVKGIPRETNGKFRAVVCRLSEEEKRKVKSLR